MTDDDDDDFLFYRRYTESPVCKMNIAVFSSSSFCCRRVWCVAGLLLATHFVLLSAGAGISALHAQTSGLQDRSSRLVVVPASFSCTCKR